MKEDYLLHSESLFRNGKWIGCITMDAWRWRFLDEEEFDDLIQQIFNQEESNAKPRS